MAKKASGEKQYAFINTRKAEKAKVINWVEIANASDETLTNASIRFYDSNGGLILDRRENFAPNEQKHINADGLLAPEEIGYVEISSDKRNSLVAQSMVYYLDEFGIPTAVYPEQFRESNGIENLHSYNLYLNMKSKLYLSNITDSAQNYRVTITSNGSMKEITVPVPAHSSSVLHLDDTNLYGTKKDSYGTVQITGANKKTFISQVLREHKDFVFVTQ